MKTKKKYFIASGILSAALLVALLFAGFAKQKETKSVLPYYNSADFTPVWNSSEGTKHTVEEFSFTDQKGAAFGSKVLDGKIYAVDFFFTSCPGICPRLTKNLSKVQEAYKNDPRVMLVSFSVTPETDVPAVLNKYAASNSITYDKWRLLTGNKKDIYTLARKSYFADEDLGLQSDENDFLHTENVLLVDSNGRLRGIYKGTFPFEVEKLITEIAQLEKE